MNLKRAILFGALLWILIFFEVSILMFGFKLEGTNYYTIHYLLIAIITIVVTMPYFKKAKKCAKEGF